NADSSSNISRINKEKRKNYSFTNDYFEKAFDPTTGEELRICNILDKNRRCCKKTYKSFGYSTGNLKRHLDEVHGINEVEIVGERKK
ncbi:19829_t:CDS:1, partial [Entrophospora sp. SA101]